MVLMGGPSSEHEVSLATAKNVIAALDPKKYLARPVLIDKAGRWFLAPSFQTPLLFSGRISKSKTLVPTAPQEALNESSGRPDVVFIAMHGTYGEDGRIQSLLDLAGIPYTGSGVLASALAMDKAKSAQLLVSQGLNIPKFTAFKKTDWNKSKKEILAKIKKLGWPLVIKPADLGSSVGVSIVKNEASLAAALKKAWQNSDYIMAQEFIRGREVTCGVLENPKTGRAFALPPTEIIPKTRSFFDYQAKYVPGASEEVTPARFPPKIIRVIQNSALTAHQTLGCRGMSRTDLMVDGPKIWVLELNTIPGMTETSLLPQAAKAAGIGFPALLDIIITGALTR